MINLKEYELPFLEKQLQLYYKYKKEEEMDVVDRLHFDDVIESIKTEIRDRKINNIIDEKDTRNM